MEIRSQISFYVTLSSKETQAIAKLIDGKAKVEPTATLLVTVKKKLEGK